MDKDTEEKVMTTNSLHVTIFFYRNFTLNTRDPPDHSTISFLCFKVKLYLFKFSRLHVVPLVSPIVI